MRIKVSIDLLQFYTLTYLYIYVWFNIKITFKVSEQSQLGIFGAIINFSKPLISKQKLIVLFNGFLFMCVTYFISVP